MVHFIHMHDRVISTLLLWFRELSPTKTLLRYHEIATAKISQLTVRSFHFVRNSAGAPGLYQLETAMKISHNLFIQKPRLYSLLPVIMKSKSESLIRKRTEMMRSESAKVILIHKTASIEVDRSNMRNFL